VQIYILATFDKQIYFESHKNENSSEKYSICVKRSHDILWLPWASQNLSAFYGISIFTTPITTLNLFLFWFKLIQSTPYHLFL